MIMSGKKDATLLLVRLSYLMHVVTSVARR